MRPRRPPVFRKAIIPWYDTLFVSIVVIVLMFLLFLFGLAGVSVAFENEMYSAHLWVPIFFLLASGILMITFTIRLFRRYSEK
jgi:hypothetical protein